MPEADQRVARIVLHGRLRKKFAKEYRVGASSAARAIQILCVLVEGFRAELGKGQYRVIRGSLKKGASLSEPGLFLRLPPNGTIHLMPVAAGGKNGGIGKVIVGVVLVVAAIVLPELLPAYFGAVGAAGAAAAGGSIAVASTIGGVSVLSGLALFGGAMILGGIASIVAKDLRPQQQLASSFLLSGALNVATAGGPVPVVYGRMRVGSVVISIGYEASAYLGSGQSGFINGVFTNDVGRTAIPGSVSANGDTGYSGDLGYLGTGRGGGGKSGSASGGYEAPNTLRSNATVRILDLLSEGPIGGLVNGPQSIFLNDTPLMGDDGVTWNFHGVSWTLMHGLPDQQSIPGFSATEQIVPVSVEVLHTNPIVRTINSSTATAVRVTIEIPALYDTDTNNGNLNQTDVQYTISQRPSKQGIGGFIGDWTDSVIENLISQKCTSPYEVSYRIGLAGRDLGANTWDIRVTKVTTDSLRASMQNSVLFSNMTIITDHQIMYSDSAYIALVFDAKAFGSSIPSRTYLIDGREINIPANYDPVARTYASSGTGTTGGTWDVISFKTAVSSNPVWVLYDMLTHDRYGANIGANFLETARADLYTIGGYCDGLVPDGFGGTEPRYTVNAVIADQTDAYTLIQTMVSAFRGMTYWGAGQVMVTADMPKNPVKLVNQDNVVGGNFNYQGTSLKTRHNLAHVTWRDPANRYTPTPETYELTADIANRGEVAAILTAWGCTSRGQAHRTAKWLVYTENNQMEVVEYDAGLYHLDLRPGEIFQQQDPAYFGLNWAGRLRSGSTASVLLLDRLLDTNPTQVSTTFVLSVVMPDTTLARVTLSPASMGRSGDGSYSVLNLAASGVALPLQPQRNAEWVLIDNNVSERDFQTISVSTGTDPGTFTISALEYDPAKFDWVEFNIAFSPKIYSTLPAQLVAALTPPSNVSATDYLVGQGTTTIIRLTVSWTPATTDLRIKEYEIQVSAPSFLQTYRAPLNTIDIDSLNPDTYSIAVRSIGKAGQVSVWVPIAADIAVDGLSDPPVAPLGVTAVGGTRRVQVSWQAVVRRDLKFYEVWRSPTTGGAPTGYSLLAQVGGTAFTDSDSNLLLPGTKWFYQVRAITTTSVAGAFSVAVSTTTTLLIVDDLADGIINAAKFAQSIKPVGLVTDLTAPGLEGDITFNEGDGRLYKFTAGTWVALINLATIDGQVQDAQIASVAASKVAGQLTAAQIVSLTAAQISGQIVASQLAAGSVTTAALAVGSASNLCWNSCLPQTADGWSIAASVGTVSGGSWPAGSWAPTGLGAGFVTTTVNLATNATQTLVAYWDPTGVTGGLDAGIAWDGATPLEVQAQLMTHRCAAHVQVDFYDAAGNYLTSAVGNRVTGLPVNDLTLSSYNQSYLITTPPAATARARAVVVAYNDGGADIAAQTTPPYIFWTQFAVGASVANATRPAPWVQGGVATIAGGMIKAGSIQGAAIAAGAIQAGKLAAGAVTAGTVAAGAITAGTVAANAITAGTIAAGAISASEIAAGTIHATMLASTFQLTSSAQIGTAIITSAHIGALQVDTSNIANNATTDMYISSGTGTVSMTVVSDGGSPMMLLVTFMDDGTGNGVDIKKDGSLLLAPVIPGNAVIPASGGSNSGTTTYSITTFMSAGTHTLSLVGHGVSNTGMAMAWFTAILVKK